MELADGTAGQTGRARTKYISEFPLRAPGTGGSSLNPGGPPMSGISIRKLYAFPQ